MKRIIHYILQAFMIGCTFFVLSTFLQYINFGEQVFTNITNQFDKIVLGILFIAIPCGGGPIFYSLSVPYIFQVALHFTSSIVTILAVSIWLNLISFTVVDVLVYAVINIAIFFSIWFYYYMMLRKESERINKQLAKLQQ